MSATSTRYRKPITRGSRYRGAGGFRTRSDAAPDLERWPTINERIRNPEGNVTIAVVGKYTGMKDAYKSLIEALSHGGIANKVKVDLDWIESEVFESEEPAPFLEHVDGILVPGGFGQRGAEGKIGRRNSRASAMCRISASASGCRWPWSRPRGICAASPTPIPANSARPWNRWSG